MQPAHHTTTELTRSLKDDLSRPDAYRTLASSKKVRLAETHLSWVFLLEEDVFKVKKPVSFGFVDFRRKEQRHAACEAEVSLNRRLAPCVYLGVVPVHMGGDGSTTIGGSGPIVDWAVHMVRLPDEERADVKLALGTLTADDVDAMAKRIASFHAGCRSSSEAARFGSLDALERNLEENFAQTRDTLGKFLATDHADELLRWQRSFLRRNASLFERRAAQGFVRDGHGDLRLEHVYFEDRIVTVLDCIEFSERFRFADTCSDVAFLAMDLAGHGRVDLAERLLAKYAREADDFDLYAVVDFYESYRAVVRGKISAILAADATVDEGRRRSAAQEARRHFLLALSSDRRSLLRPEIVAVGGLMASGKTTVAEGIATGLGAPVVEADRTRKSLLGLAPTASLNEEAWGSAYDPEVAQNIYREVMRRAAVVLDSGRPVVIDASFRASWMRTAVCELASQRGVPFRFVECQAPDEVCRARLIERNHSRTASDGRLAIFDAFRAGFEPVRDLPAEKHIVLDTTHPVEANLQELDERLDTWQG